MVMMAIAPYIVLRSQENQTLIRVTVKPEFEHAGINFLET